MAIRINDTTVVDDSANANLTHVSVSSLGFVNIGTVSNTPPHAGTLYGYASGGVNPARPVSIFIQNVERFSFASEAPGTNVASVGISRRRGSSCSSELAGYAMGGDSTPSTLPPYMGLGYYFNIEKFNFATEAPSTGVGNMQYVRTNSGTGVASPTHGYAAGCRTFNEFILETERFAFANDVESAIVGSLTYYRQGPSEAASLTNSYVMNGNYIGAGPPISVNTSIIEKYKFASETEGVFIGDTTLVRWLGGAASSPTHAYAISGLATTPVVRYRRIDKVSFAAEGNASIVGDLSSNNGSMTATTSAFNGYTLGGATSNNPPAPVIGTNAIDKFPFATDTNATDIADLVEVKFQTASYNN